MISESRFWAKVDKRGPDECWEWLAYKETSGYGKFTVGKERDRTKKRVQAHRISWQIANGPIPKGMWVLHRCDNPPCVNPRHLFLGTHVDNMRDMVRKGRQGGFKNRGAGNGRAKLTERDVLEIRLSEGETQQKLALRFGVSPSLICTIKKKINWRCLDD